MTFIGTVLMAAAIVMTWLLWPRDGKEGRVMRLPGMWIVIPLTIMMVLGTGGALVFTQLGR
jgi:hypothetical protein